MTQIVVTTDIAAPPADVWSAVEPIERHVEWMADAESIRFLGAQTRGIGTRFECITKVGPVRLSDMMEITEWEPGATMGVRHEGLVTGTGRFTLEPLDGGRRTHFTWTEDLTFPWYLGGRLGERIGGPTVMKRIWTGNLTRLRQLVEQVP
ncbi:MAG: SRPBCC family protein [Acidimicrobiia bacterium]|nr:SRPBCC family protein [Acidimicrobiia bacterium]